MPQLTTSNNQFQFSSPYTITKKTGTNILLSTANQFVDHNISLTFNVQEGTVVQKNVSADATLSNTDTSNGGINIYPVMGTKATTEPIDGYFIAIDASGSAQNRVSSPGWLAAGDLTVMNAGPTTYYFPIDVGAVTVTGGALSAGNGHVSLSAASGYYDGTSYDTTDIVDITTQTTEASGYYKLVAQGYGDVNRGAIYQQNTTSGYIHASLTGTTVSESTSLSSSIFSQNYYIAKSTLSTNSITPSATQQTVTIGTGYYPTNRTITINAITPINPTTNASTTGLENFAYQGTALDKDITIQPMYTTASAGFVDQQTNRTNGGITYWKVTRTSISQGTTTTVLEDPDDPDNNNVIATRGSVTWGNGWITTGSISPASFDNTPTNNVTYVDITNSTEAPVLDSVDGYLYINQGYTDNLKIHIGKFISPDVTISRTDQILESYTAYDANGNLLTGIIPSKNGSHISQSGDTITVPWGKYEGTVGQHDAVTYQILGGSYAASGSINTYGLVTPKIELTSGASNYGFTTTLPASGQVAGTDYIKIDPSTDANASTDWSVDAVATITTAGYIGTGYDTATITGTPIIANGTNYYIPIVTPTFSGGVVSGSSTTSITTNMATIQDDNTTDYYIDASSTGSANRTAVTYTNDAGVIAAHSGATASAAPETAATITSTANRVYVPAAIGAVNMTAGNGDCQYNTTNSVNVYVSDTNTSGVAIGFSGAGTVSAVASITTAGYAPQTNSFATGTSTQSQTADAIKYLTGIKLVPPETGTRYFDIEIPNGSTTDFIVFRFTVDTLGNVTVAEPDPIVEPDPEPEPNPEPEP